MKFNSKHTRQQTSSGKMGSVSSENALNGIYIQCFPSVFSAS